MAITLTYRPDKGLSFGDKLLLWGTPRQDARNILNNKFQADNDIIDFSEYHNGDRSYNIIHRRDIYKGYRGADNFFFLNYDPSDNLREVEVHHGLEIIIGNITIDFSMTIEEAASALVKLSSERKKIAEGEYFFKDLKLTIASGEAMGSEGNELSYFYCSKDVSHLIDN